jgi:hypothetical protein
VDRCPRDVSPCTCAQERFIESDCGSVSGTLQKMLWSSLVVYGQDREVAGLSHLALDCARMETQPRRPPVIFCRTLDCLELALAYIVTVCIRR